MADAVIDNPILNGSGSREGLLFPWVVSDFSLVDGIESGLVKIPRVPVADDSASGDRPGLSNSRSTTAAARLRLPRNRDRNLSQVHEILRAVHGVGGLGWRRPAGSTAATPGLARPRTAWSRS